MNVATEDQRTADDLSDRQFPGPSEVVDRGPTDAHVNARLIDRHRQGVAGDNAAQLALSVAEGQILKVGNMSDPL